MTEALPPEIYQGVHLLCSCYRLDTLTTLSIVLVDKHLDKAANVRYAAQQRSLRAGRRPPSSPAIVHV